jgi:hypothetical protein
MTDELSTTGSARLCVGLKKIKGDCRAPHGRNSRAASGRLIQTRTLEIKGRAEVHPLSLTEIASVFLP